MGKQWKNKPNKNVVAGVKKASTRGMSLAAEHVLGVAKQQVPIEEHILEESGFTSVDGTHHIRAAVSFDTPYAVRQHEDMTLKHDEGRNAKYLENAFNSEQDAVKQIIAAELRGEL
jgi:hypothetical protein